MEYDIVNVVSLWLRSPISLPNLSTQVMTYPSSWASVVLAICLPIYVPFSYP